MRGGRSAAGYCLVVMMALKRSTDGVLHSGGAGPGASAQ